MKFEIAAIVAAVAGYLSVAAARIESIAYDAAKTARRTAYDAGKAVEDKRVHAAEWAVRDAELALAVAKEQARKVGTEYTDRLYAVSERVYG